MKTNQNFGIKVYVGMSGGVDSSVAAALLKQQGYDVAGVYMKNWTQDLPGMKCPWADDLADAKRVAVQLDIPFKVFDFQKEYKQQVVDYMISEYQAGRTPNPDVMCNQEIKFDIFLKTAIADGADMIATGHYARVEHFSSSASLALAGHDLCCNNTNRASEVPSRQNPNVILCTGLDKAKDQSYFLYRVTEAALQKTLLPVGELTKPEVRKLAAKFGLATAEKKDSQGICFVGSVGIKDFLLQYITAESGNIINKKSGEVIGRHDGAIFYTFGQRHGLNVGGGLPYYVVGKDMSKNEIYVTTDLNDETLWRTDVNLRQLHWINQPPAKNKQYDVRMRYRATLIKAKVVNMHEDHLQLQLADPERAITPGQSAVIYDGDRVVGGGIVE
ncbi:MAG: tRNA 2-thiouridine(34) synthase MnmA [Candidatus Woesebacteria bacterium]